MLPPKPVFTRRVALIEAAGFTADQLPQDGFDADGFYIIGDYPALGRVHYGLNEFPKTRIEWANDESRKAAFLAMQNDFNEAFDLPLIDEIPRPD